MMKSKSIYISEVKKKIKISSKYKKEFLETLNSNLDIYLEYNPNATYKDIENDFGKVDDIIKSYYDSIDDEEIINRLKNKKIVIISVIIFLVMILSIYIKYFYDFGKAVPAYSVEEVTEFIE